MAIVWRGEGVDYDTVSAGDFGASLRGIGLNLLVRDVPRQVAFLPENPPRGAGIEIRLYDTDPDEVCTRAEALGGTILQGATDKPHGLREAYVLCENGYAWVVSRAL